MNSLWCRESPPSIYLYTHYPSYTIPVGTLRKMPCLHHIWNNQDLSMLKSNKQYLISYLSKYTKQNPSNIKGTLTRYCKSGLFSKANIPTYGRISNELTKTHFQIVTNGTSDTSQCPICIICTSQTVHAIVSWWNDNSIHIRRCA